jgi:hypothetical protein
MIRAINFQNSYLLVICLICTSCVPPSGTSDVWIKEGKDLTQYKTVEVQPVSDSTGITHELDISGVLTQLLIENIEAAGYLHKPGGIQNYPVLTLQVQITDYQKGNALARWVAPGVGKAKCVIRSALIDKQSAQVIGEILTIKEVTASGLYSVGAENYILEDAAEEIAEKLSANLSGEKEQK